MAESAEVEEQIEQTESDYLEMSDEDFDVWWNTPRSGGGCLCNWKYESCSICNPNGQWERRWV